MLNGSEIHVHWSKCKTHDVRTTIQKSFYRNGQLREAMPLRNGRRHGVARVWHKNGVLASEEPYQTACCMASAASGMKPGRLLGKYRMVHGTGIQRAWHDNGKLQMEFSTVRGEFCGRNRIWLRDGTLAVRTTFTCTARLSAPTNIARPQRKTNRLPKLGGKPANLAEDRRRAETHSPSFCRRRFWRNRIASKRGRGWKEARRQDRAFARTIQARA